MPQVPTRTEKRAVSFTEPARNSALRFFLRKVLVSTVVTITAALVSPLHAGLIPPTAAQLKMEERALRVYAIRSYLTELRRAERVTYSLLQAAAPYCVNRRKYSLGVPPLSARDLPPDLRLGFAEWLATDRPDALRFVHVHGLSPAARAGVQEGDILLSMIDHATGKTIHPGWVMDRPGSTMASSERITLEIERGKIKLSVTPVPQLICDIRLNLLQTDKLVATAHAGQLTVSTGLLRFVPSDDELALLLANELVHDQFRHARATKGIPLAASPSNLSTPFTADEERNADYLSTYLIVAAYFNIANAPNVWKRFSIDPYLRRTKDIALRHPFTPARSFHLASTVEEIRLKTQAGERVVPNPRFAPLLLSVEFDTITSRKPDGPAASSPPVAEESPQLRSITNIPFINNEGLAGYQRFLDTPLRPRAFAIGPYIGRSGGAWAYKTGVNAAADALAHCSLIARGPCYLYAVDDQLVWNALTAQDQPEAKQISPSSGFLTQAPAATNFAAIDDVEAVPLSLAQLARYRAFLEKPSPRAFVITQQGLSRYWVGPAATHDALAYCARADEPCWLYAVNDRVVWSKDPEKRISSRDQLPPATEESGLLEK